MNPAARPTPADPRWNPDGKPRKPQIVGIGAQKAGTTWLSQMLGQHPMVWAPPFKEAQFFNHRFIEEHRAWVPWHFKRARQTIEKRHAAKNEPVPPHLDAYLARITDGEMFTNHWYKQVFAPTPEGAMALDVTPEYSTLPDAGVDFVASFLPQAKFIYIIRHPVDRAVSQLKMNLTRRNRRPANVQQWLEEVRDPVLLDRGDYAAYVPRWTARLTPDRLLILPFGLIARDPVGLLRRIEDFLGLPRHDYRRPEARVFPGNAALSLPEPARAALRARVRDQFDFLAETFPPDFNAMLR